MRWGKNLRGLRISEIFTASTLSSCAAGLRLSNGRGAELLARRQARARAFPRALVSSRQQEAPYDRAAGSQASGIDVHRLRGGGQGHEIGRGTGWERGCQYG